MRPHAGEGLRHPERHLHRRLLPLASLVLALAGCSSPSATQAGDGGVDGDPFAEFDAGDPFAVDASIGRRAQIFLSGCNGIDGCHQSNAGKLNFPSGDESRLLIDVPSFEKPALLRVKRGDPSASYVYAKVLGDGGIQGARMPPGPKFDPRLPAFFFDWIEAGAPAP